jgi:septum formation protein
MTGGSVPPGNRLVLASKSPQSQAILTALGVHFEVRPSDFAEIEGGEAERVAVENALGKALAVPPQAGELVLGVDTVVAARGRLWGKPADVAAARETLAALSGATHLVVSGLALTTSQAPARTATCATAVSFRELDAAMLDWYMSSGEWRERAGGYAIQGAGSALVQSISGDWTNVVGLPVGTLLGLLPSLLVQHSFHDRR